MFKVAVSSIALTTKPQRGSPVWKQLAGSFVNKELDAFELARAISEGRAFTTWHSNNWRCSKNFILGQHLALDFDTETESSRIDVLLQRRFINTYASILYTTPSHQVSAPRARVVFLLDQPIHYAENYAQAAAALVWMFKTADTACKDPARSWGGSYNCESVVPANVLPLSVVKQVTYQHQKATAKPEYEPREYTVDEREIAEALQHIPPWGIPYDDWLRVLAALHHTLGNEGLSLAEEWAEGEGNEIRTKWRSFSPIPAGAPTIATVFYMAKQFGWQPERNK